jgi:hypothetical protein
MELKTYKVKYSITVNGDEYPNVTEIQAIDESEARQNLKNIITKTSDVEFHIHEVNTSK